MIFCKRSKCIYRHFKAHFANSGFFSKIDYEIFTFNFTDKSRAPCTVEHKTLCIKRDMFFKIVYRFKYVAEILCKIGRFYVFVKMTVPFVFSFKTFGYFLARPHILRIIGQNLFKQTDRDIPLFIVFVPRVKFLY